MNITLATLGNFTAQQVFDKVATHLLTQNAKSLGVSLESDFCRYRGEGGTMCAAGCLIAEDEYISRQMEGKSWNAEVFPDAHRELIRALQQLHDLDEVEFWCSGLGVVAANHDLDTAALHNVQLQITN